MELPRLVAGVRTPFGKYGGRLREVEPVPLALTVLRETLARAGGVIPEAVVVGMGCFESGMFVPARQIAVEVGLPTTTPSLTIDRACCSGMSSIGAGWKDVRAGVRKAVAAVGVESLSRTPYLVRELRWGVKRGDIELQDPLAFRSPLSQDAQIARYTGEMAVGLGYDRTAQDDWALTSHHRYGEAIGSGVLDDQVLGWSTVLGLEESAGRTDEQYRPDISPVALAKLKTVYGSPTVTAGNAPGLNDGAASAMVVAAHVAADLAPGSSGEIVDYLETAGGVTEAVVMPGRAICALLDRNGLALEDISVIEINEAYAATVLCSTLVAAGDDRTKARSLRERTNIWGGAIAIGHPLGASGVRISLNIIDQLRRRGGGYGIAAVCGGFGQTDALLLKVD